MYLSKKGCRVLFVYVVTTKQRPALPAMQQDFPSGKFRNHNFLPAVRMRREGAIIQMGRGAGRGCPVGVVKRSTRCSNFIGHISGTK